MSTLQFTATLGISKIPLSRRISEILVEKGDEFSIRKFAKRIGMNRETLRSMILGGRPILPTQIELIIGGLGIDVERLKQTDTLKSEQELYSILKAKSKTKVMLMRASELAEKLNKIALGATERATSLNNLGRVLYLLQKYEEAHNIWERALDYAQQIYESFGDNELLHLITCNLMLTFIIRKEYSNIEEKLNVVEKAFIERPESLGGIHYIRMKIYEDRGNLDLAKEHAYLSLHHLEQTHDSDQICKALVNVAHYEFLSKNYDKSADMLRKAIEIAEINMYHVIFAAKEYVKTLIKLKNFDGATDVLIKFLEYAKVYPDLHAKLCILYSIVQNTPEYAETVLKDSEINPEIRHQACAFLMSYYSYQDDSISLMKYYKMGRMLSSNKPVYFDEGDL